MRPVRTAESNVVYVGPPGVGDLHCERVRPGWIRSVWALDPIERDLIAAGANIQLDVLTEPVPPVVLGISTETGVGEDAPEIADRLREWKAQQ